MGIRTPDLLIANETLYQLSYTPNLVDFNNLHVNIFGARRGLSIPIHRCGSKRRSAARRGTSQLLQSTRMSLV